MSTATKTAAYAVDTKMTLGEYIESKQITWAWLLPYGQAVGTEYADEKARYWIEGWEHLQGKINDRGEWLWVEQKGEKIEYLGTWLSCLIVR